MRLPAEDKKGGGRDVVLYGGSEVCKSPLGDQTNELRKLAGRLGSEH